MTCPSPRPKLPWRAGVGVAATALMALPAYGAFAQTGSSSAGALTVDDGYLSEPVSPFDTESPAVANLDPALRAAIQQAATDARRDGVRIMINSGWRSGRYQQHLLDDAIASYGPSEADRRVNGPDRSTHVTGKAVDAGPPVADRWLQRHGAAYGLCQVYANEIWHYELTTRPGRSCPPQLPDASAD
ncbi:M15 family metallopeptidase [Catellatospora tritici]|uniref:M15 family metallopeptidase n=1 Tax=Catellatospora tritici TaxID=2851566 RepID=UPI001C2D6A1E|nr:M15 family metallopeptidase [Catellatospora tritici]MBV1856674.1 M15 family metallopeptidase [Catellatospora tritici]